jgi:hypothetical protein
MYAVYAQCASVRPIQPFYLTKREAPYNAFSQIMAWADPQQKVRRWWPAPGILTTISSA